MAPRRAAAASLLAHVEPLAADLLQRLQAEMPAYRDIDRDQLVPVAVTVITRALTALGEERDFTRAELEIFRDQGELRGRQGVPIEDMLLGWRLAVRTALEGMVALGSQNNITDRDLLGLTQDILTITDAAIVAIASGHHDAQRELAGDEQARLADFIRAVLLGGLSRAELRIRAAHFGLNPDGEYHAIRARTENTGDVPRRLGLTPGTSTRGLAALIDGDIAGLIDRRPKALPGTLIGIGPAARLDNLEPSFQQATRVMTTAAAFGLSGVHDLPDLGLLPAVLGEHDIGDELVRRYVSPLGTGVSADTLLETVRHYLSLGMRADLVAQRLVVHHNTVRYRLRRFEELTGTNLRDPDRALEAWWALQRHRLTDSTTGSLSAEGSRAYA